MDTVTEVTVLLSSGISPMSIWESVDSLLRDWDERFSVTGEKSEIEVINKRTDKKCKVSPHLSSMIEMALQYGDTLDGMFDITILPIKELWGFGEESSDTQPLPDEKTVDSVV
ncbi:MAG: FAD:protein FMN transferase, partial [Chitinispirillaceae bacterium]|nr:FAD:protein FMN transferase [Chitinispirillaceae bacterium]